MNYDIVYIIIENYAFGPISDSTKGKKKQRSNWREYLYVVIGALALYPDLPIFLCRKVLHGTETNKNLGKIALHSGQRSFTINLQFYSTGFSFRIRSKNITLWVTINNVYFTNGSDIAVEKFSCIVKKLEKFSST